MYVSFVYFSQELQGICGNINGDISDEFTTKDGIDVKSKPNKHTLLGNSWRVDTSNKK